MKYLHRSYCGIEIFMGEYKEVKEGVYCNNCASFPV
jgi:hypothetical protein